MLTEDTRARREKVVLDYKSPKGLLTLVRVLRGFAKLSRQPKDVIADTPARTA